MRYIFALCIWAAASGPAYAQVSGHESVAETAVQDTSVPADPDVDWVVRYEELERWVHGFTAWQEWSEQWLNRRQPGWFGTQSRRARPDPPSWLDAECQVFIEAEGLFQRACELLAIWKDPDVADARRERADAQLQREAPTKTKWWEHVHLDVLWPMTQLGASTYGVVGTHVTMEMSDRLQIFVAPGVMLMNLPAERGRKWTPAADWGISYRLFEFKAPGFGRRARLHVNVAKAWIFAGPKSIARTSVDLAGFSLTFAPNTPTPTPTPAP